MHLIFDIWPIVLLVATVNAAPQNGQTGYRYVYVPRANSAQQPPKTYSLNARAAVPVSAILPAGAGIGPSLAVVPAQPHTGIAGASDTGAAATANFGNGVGAALNAAVSGFWAALGVLWSGITGSGSVDSSFLNFNNQPPAG